MLCLLCRFQWNICVFFNLWYCVRTRILHVWKYAGPQIRILPEATATWNSTQQNISDGSWQQRLSCCVHSYWRQFSHHWLKPKQCTTGNTARHETFVQSDFWRWVLLSTQHQQPVRGLYGPLSAAFLMANALMHFHRYENDTRHFYRHFFSFKYTLLLFKQILLRTFPYLEKTYEYLLRPRRMQEKSRCKQSCWYDLQIIVSYIRYDTVLRPCLWIGRIVAALPVVNWKSYRTYDMR